MPIVSGKYLVSFFVKECLEPGIHPYRGEYLADLLFKAGVLTLRREDVSAFAPEAGKNALCLHNMKAFCKIVEH